MQLQRVLNERLGTLPPGMTDVRKALDDVLVLANETLQRKGGPIVAETAVRGAGQRRTRTGPCGGRTSAGHAATTCIAG